MDFKVWIRNKIRPQISSSKDQLNNVKAMLESTKNDFQDRSSVENDVQLGDSTKDTKFESTINEIQVDMGGPPSNYTKDYQRSLDEQRMSPSEANRSLVHESASEKEPSSDLKSVEISNHDHIGSKNNQDDYILNVLNDLPEQWVRKEMRLHIIVDRSDATWLTRRVFEDIQRGLIIAQITVKEWNNLCDITLVVKIADVLASFPAAVTAINPVFSFLLSNIKSELVFRRNKRIKDNSSILK